MMLCWLNMESFFFIEVLIDDMVHHHKWRLVIVYASTDDRKRAQQFDVLSKRISHFLEPCLVMGDFNDLLLDSEKDGGNRRSAASMRIFRNFVATSCLLDLGFEGHPFTWRNRRDEGFIEERIDRALATNDWVSCYSYAVVKHVVLEGSDHAMLLLSMEVRQPRWKKQFMYDPRWNQEDQCVQVVRNGVRHVIMKVDSPDRRLVSKLKQVKFGLLGWRKRAGRNEQNEIIRLKETLRHEYQQPVFDGPRIQRNGSGAQAGN